MEAMRTVKIPRTGYFVLDPHGNLRTGEKRTHRHTIPDPPRMPPLDHVFTVRRTPRPLKSYLVEALDCVRNHGQALGDAALIDGAYQWLEGHGMIEAVELVKNDPLFVYIRYRITPNGESFLAQHEAPIYW